MDQVIQVVQVVRMISVDDMHSVIYGFHGPNHQIIEKSRDITPVTNRRTNGRIEESCKKSSIVVDQKLQKQVYVVET